MSTIKNGPILLHCHFNKIIKGPGTNVQSSGFSQKHVRNVFSYRTLVFDQISFWQYLGFKKNKHKSKYRYRAILMMTSQIWKSADFTKTQKSRYLENKTLFFLQIFKFINYTSRVTL